ncbi:uncharacterized [Tachysurus ichikawai]
MPSLPGSPGGPGGPREPGRRVDPPVPINTLSPHRRSAPECLSLLIPDKPEPPAQRGEGWTDRAKDRTERGGGGQRPGADRVGGTEEDV